jgi:hypothetical protein
MTDPKTPMPKIFRKPAAVLGVILLLGGCTTVSEFLVGDTTYATPVTKPGVDGRTDWNGTAAKTPEELFQVARTPQEWRDLWQLAGTDSPGALPEGMMAVGVFAGRKQTTGYTVSITGVDLVQELAMPLQIIVTYRIVPPSNAATVTQTPTSPWAIALTPARDMPVQFAAVAE